MVIFAFLHLGIHLCIRIPADVMLFRHMCLYLPLLYLCWQRCVIHNNREVIKKLNLFLALGNEYLEWKYDLEVLAHQNILFKSVIFTLTINLYFWSDSLHSWTSWHWTVGLGWYLMLSGSLHTLILRSPIRRKRDRDRAPPIALCNFTVLHAIFLELQHSCNKENQKSD